ncbi:MAG: type II toxin-antitoxin system VapC family toxin [Gaiellaceae bacterium]
MILDTSAILAVLFDEPERAELVRKIGAADDVAVGAPTLVEASIVLSALAGEAGHAQLAGFVERVGAVVVAFGAAHWRSAADAWLRYGKGRHPAALNLGDCLAYAAAAVAAQPLLCKGDDFARTDLRLA